MCSLFEATAARKMSIMNLFSDTSNSVLNVKISGPGDELRFRSRAYTRIKPTRSLTISGGW
jgi:hypothetical protein